MKQEEGAGKRGAQGEEGKCGNENIADGGKEGKGKWVPRVWEQGGTQLEPAVQVAPSLADLGDHL